MKIAVTGARGLLGSVVAQMLERDHDVRRIDKKSTHPTLEGVDLRFIERAYDFLDGVDAVIHLAGLRASVAQQHTHGYELLSGNLQIDLNVFRVMREFGIKRGVYASTVSVYPERSDAPDFVEEDANAFPAESVKYSAWGKLTAERLLGAWGDHQIATVRLVNTYGPNDDFGPHALVIPALIRRALKGPLVVEGDRETERDFLFVDDAARGIVAAFNAQTSRTFNLGSGIGHPLHDVATFISDACGQPPPIFTGRAGAITGARRKVVDPSRAEKELGWKAEVSLKDGIEHTVAWAKKYLTP